MTLKDIAEKAGVSTMTVSNVINGKQGRVSPETIRKVNAIIKEYGYVPNLNARSLTRKSSHIIGVIIPLNHPDSETDIIQNPYVSTMLSVIERSLRLRGYYMLLRCISEEEDLNVMLKSWHVDGVIFLYPLDTGRLSSVLDSLSCPAAVFDSDLEYEGLINVCSDDRTGLYLATKYLINRGHTHIVFASDYKGKPNLERRFRGYLDALEECRLPFREEYVCLIPADYKNGIRAGQDIAIHGSPVTAVVTTADYCAIGIMEGARLGGYRIPYDLSVIGYDNLPVCQYTTPKLTSVSQNVTLKASEAVRLLLEKIENGTNPPQKRIVLDVELVERQSALSLL